MSLRVLFQRVFQRCLPWERQVLNSTHWPHKRSISSDSSALYEAPNIKQLPVQVRERLHAAEDSYGFIPNFLHVYSRRPKEFAAFFEYHDALISKERGNLTRAEKEMIALVTSAEQHCLYCAIAHSGLLKKNSKDPVKPEQLIVDWKQSDITKRQKAIISFAMAVKDGRDAYEDLKLLSSHGLDSEDAWDIVAIMALSTMTGYMAKLTNVKANEQFYNMSNSK